MNGSIKVKEGKGTRKLKRERGGREQLFVNYPQFYAVRGIRNKLFGLVELCETSVLKRKTITCRSEVKVIQITEVIILLFKG